MMNVKLPTLYWLLWLSFTILTACDASKVTKYATASNELRGFQTKVYKLARENTCVACHDKTQASFFAADDPQAAYDAIMAARKVNFQRPELSRIYQRLY